MVVLSAPRPAVAESLVAIRIKFGVTCTARALSIVGLKGPNPKTDARNYTLKVIDRL